MQGWKGRGSAENPRGRFETTVRFRDELVEEPPEAASPRTEFVSDQTRSIIARNDSPDIPFDASVNPYRGCEFGCAYCYARPFHEYLGYSAGLDFETRILVKHDAPALLRRELSSPRWEPQTISISGVTDPYQPAERRFQITRGCLEVLAEFRNPVAIITKSALVARDIDILAELARHQAAAVCVTMTTNDPALSRALEPRASLPAQRLETIRALSQAGIPVGVFCAPVIPGLTETMVPTILAEAAQAGASFASYLFLRLPGAVEGLFLSWLDRHAPARKEKIVGRVRQLRDGRLNDPRFGRRFQASGTFAAAFSALFEGCCQANGLVRRGPQLSTAAFRRAGSAPVQGLLFDSEEARPQASKSFSPILDHPQGSRTAPP